MPFKIVQTIEDKEVCLTLVPGTWEENGVLFWPNKKSQVAKLAQDEYSRPTEKWERINCVKKREFSSRDEAEYELENMEARSDTDADDIRALVPSQKKIARLQKTHIISNPDFNDFVPKNLQVFTSLDHDTLFKKKSNQSTSRQFMQPQSAVAPEITSFLPNQNCSLVVNEPQELLAINEPNSEIIINQDLDEQDLITLDDTVDISNSLQSVLDNQDKIMKKVANLQTSFDELAKMVLTRLNLQAPNSAEQPSSSTIIQLQPINSVQQLDELEERLKDEVYIANLVESMIFICGSTGKSDGIDCCYKLIDLFLTRQFLLDCSWTGNARSSSVSTKVALKFYERFRKCFLAIVMRADRNFTEMQCDQFFKRIMKNSKQRTMAKKIESNHKARPKNLKYKRVQKSITDQTTLNIDNQENVDPKSKEIELNNNLSVNSAESSGNEGDREEL